MSSLDKNYRVDWTKGDVTLSSYPKTKRAAMPYYNRLTKQGCHVTIYTPEATFGRRRVILAGAAPIRRSKGA